MVLLSFGMLALGVMLSFAVQMPKLSGYRATATILASGHIERMRANPVGFTGGKYTPADASNPSYDGTFKVLEEAKKCNSPYDDPKTPGLSDCVEADLATNDTAFSNAAVRRQLPAGGMLVTCDPQSCGENSYGNLWIFWQEPVGRAVLDPSASDNCPPEVTAQFTNPRPRCLYVRFRV